MGQIGYFAVGFRTYAKFVVWAQEVSIRPTRQSLIYGLDLLCIEVRHVSNKLYTEIIDLSHASFHKWN